MARRSDLGSRLKTRARTLRTHLARRETLIETLRQAHATHDPASVARWLVRQAGSWVPAACWAVVTNDANGQMHVIAEEGLTPHLAGALSAAATWVVRNGSPLLAADLSRDLRVPEAVAGSTIAFPLVARQRMIGALVGLDPTPSIAVPAVTPGLAAALDEVLEPSALALDNAFVIQRAEALSITDDLTRLYNSRFLNLVLRRESKRAARTRHPVSLLFVDLDGFKRVNDTHGHVAGSAALFEVGSIIRDGARETDSAARFGGDEFAVVLPDTSSDGAASLAERIRERVAARDFLSSHGLSIRLTASIGVATLPDVAASAEELLRGADAAMYRVKGEGGNGVHIAQEASAF